MKRFEWPIQVQPAHIDGMGHVNNVVYVQWVQDAAAAHWNSVATPELQSRYAWVVIRHEVDYKSAALPADELVAVTWVHDFDGARSTRIVQIIRKENGKLLAEARTTWCLLATSTNRPTRVPEEIKKSFDIETFL